MSLTELLTTNLGTSHPSAGGFLSQMTDALRQHLLRSSQGLASSTQVTTMAAYLDVPVVDDGVAVTWVAEGSEIPMSAPNTRTVRVIPGRALGIVPVSVRAIQAEEIDLVQMITKELGRSLVRTIDASFYNPTDAPGPTGGLGSIADPVTVKSKGGLKSTDPLVEALGLIEAADFQPTDLHVSPDVLTKLRLLKDADGRPLVEPDLSMVGLATASTASVSASPGVRPGEQSPAPLLSGLRLRVSTQLPANTAWVTSADRVVATLNGPTKFESSADALFTREMVAIRASQSVGWSVTDREAAVKIDLSA